MAGGKKSVFNKVKPVLDKVGKKTVYVGKSGDASRLKLVVNQVLFLNQASAVEGFAHALKAGLNPDVLYEVLVSGAAASDLIAARGKAMLAGDFGQYGTIVSSLKDMGLALESGRRRSLAVTLLGWIVAILFAWAAQGPELFWIAANLIGLCLGSSQSAGRALIGYLSPEARRAEFFGLWGLAVKLSAISGPLTYGWVSWVSRGDHRLALLMIGGYFVLGLIILAGIDVGRGRSAVLAAAEKT